MLEAAQHESNNFVTLTYSNDFLPTTSNGLPNLDPRELQLFLKRLRKDYSPLRFRFFGVGEYSPAERPHFHLILFGYPVCQRGQTKVNAQRGNPEPTRCCSVCQKISSLWSSYNEEQAGFVSKGLIYCGMVTEQSAAYVAGYVEKKMTMPDDYRLNGRNPEFSRMSLKPGIGVGMMHEVASELLRYDLEKTLDDVPSQLRHGKRVMPLGRHLRGKLREAIGRDKKAPQSTLDQMAEELRPLRESAFNNSRSFKTEVIDAGSNKVLQLETREKIKRSRKNSKGLKRSEQ